MGEESWGTWGWGFEDGGEGKNEVRSGGVMDGDRLEMGLGEVEEVEEAEEVGVGWVGGRVGGGCRIWGGLGWVGWLDWVGSSTRDYHPNH